MTNKELKEKITYLETELAEVKEMAEAMKKRVDGGAFKPEDGQTYWSFTRVGGVSSDWWNGHKFDHDRYSIGNCFPNKQAAEDTVRVLKLIQKARESQDGFVPDWGDSTQPKYLLSFISGDIYVTRNWSTNAASAFGYWEGKSMCEQFIEENHDELIWFFTEYQR